MCFIEAQSWAYNHNEDPREAYVKLNGIVAWHYNVSSDAGYPVGVNVFIVHRTNCTLQERRRFNTQDRDEAEMLRDYLRGLRHGTVLVGVAYAEPMRTMRPPHPNAALSELSKLGADVSDVKNRGAFVFATRIGDPASTVLKKLLDQISVNDTTTRQPRIFATFSGAQYTIYHSRALISTLSSLHCVP